MILREITYLIFAFTMVIAMLCVHSQQDSHRIYNHHFLIRRSHPTKRPQDDVTDAADEGNEESGSTDDVSITKVEMSDLQYDEEDYSYDEEFEDIFKGFKLNEKEPFEKGYPKKYSHQTEKEAKLEFSHKKEATTTVETETFLEQSENISIEPTPVSSTTTTISTTTTAKPSTLKIDDPLALPVTTEGKKTEDPLKVYGMPKELLPIMPGGGSRFEDIEREKVEKKKMSQTKGVDDSAESGSSHEAEGLYSSGSLSSFYLCFYSMLSFLFIDRVIL